MKKMRCRNQSGFSLVEAMMATVVLGIAAAGVLLPFTSGASVRAEGMRQTLAAKLAGDLMEQVVKKPFADIVGSYNYTESQGQVKDVNGVVFTDSNYTSFSRAVSSACVRVSNQDETFTPNFIRVTVRVYYNGKETAVINRLVSK